MTNTQYIQFVETMTQAINAQAIRTGDTLMSVSEVASLPECVLAYQATVAMSYAVASI